jgi:hypothetical protein
MLAVVGTARIVNGILTQILGWCLTIGSAIIKTEPRKTQKMSEAPML